VFGSGSTGNIVKSIYRMLDEKGQDCFIAFGRGKKKSNKTSIIKIGEKVVY